MIRMATTGCQVEKMTTWFCIRNGSINIRPLGSVVGTAFRDFVCPPDGLGNVDLGHIFGGGQKHMSQLLVTVIHCG